jgi:hypothetical protein
MLLTSDDTDPEQVSLAWRLENEQRNLGFIASNGLSLLKGARLPVRWRNAAKRLLLTNGRTRSFSRTRASGSHDSRPRRRRGSVSPAFGTAHLSSARLLQTPLRTNRAWFDGSGGPPARGVSRHSYLSPTYDRSQPFTPWIHAIARYKFLDYLRRTKSSFKDLPFENAHELTSNSDMTAVDSGLDLQGLLSEISSKAREAIQYVKLDGLSVSEAAARSGMSESAVKVAVHRGLKALALRIRQERGA